MIKLLFLDIDGTLTLNRFSEAKPEIVDLIKRLSKKIKICFCTGRSLTDVKIEVERFGLEDNYHVIEGGAKMLGPGLDIEYSKNITLKDVEKILITGKSLAYDFGICEDGNWKDTFAEVVGTGVTMVSLNSNSSKMTQDILSVTKPILQEYSVALCSHSKFVDGAHIHITHKEATKGFGVKYMQKKFGITKAETAGAGDMPNDLPMLEECGLKIVMGNAHPDLLKIADKIVGKVNEDGLTDFLSELLT